MKKLFLISFCAINLLSIRICTADEGMWLPMFIERLNYVDMQKMGCHLTPEEIYSVNHSSLKDAVIQFGGGCTAEIVSGEGLVLTNHHCGRDRIQSHSTLEHDYLTNGFWAMNKNEELVNKGLTISMLIRIEDVTKKVLAELSDKMTEKERDDAIKKISTKIESAATKGTQYRARVRSFYSGNEFYLFVTQTFRDIRLVGAPPSSIGMFGGDADNWMWPRHTGDFSIFRVYTAPDGSPAEYSDKNIPYKPKYFLPISLNGIKKDDYAMVMGYPGGTDRFLTSYGVKFQENIKDPTVVKIRDKKLEIIKQDMDASPEVRLKYATKYYGASNYWKFYIGEGKQLKKYKVFDKKKEIEDQFMSWVNADNKRKEKYGNLMQSFADAYDEYNKYYIPTTYFSEAIMRGPEVIGFSGQLVGSRTRLLKLIKDSANAKVEINKEIENLKDDVIDFYRNYDLITDKKLFVSLLRMFYNNVPKEQQPAILRIIEKKYKPAPRYNEKKFKVDFEEYAEYVYDKSFFADELKLNEFLENPDYKVLEKDPVFLLMKSFYSNNDSLRTKLADAQSKITATERLYIAGLREMSPDKKFYPKANGTMRLTYGKVNDCIAADAVYYNYFTTLDGVMEKEDSANPEFIVPAKLKELYIKKDYGRYSSNGTVPVCFITDNDITGGNSGSPVINGDGQLIGIAFDGNWESMCEKIHFEPKLARCINVDIRYVLFVIDKYAGASNIINEMTIVDNKTNSSQK
ncbi:MAG: S46 family peptidase [Bacteroidales bacterium]|nr:S46 family peptidase [Bacteroidales bacterium]